MKTREQDRLEVWALGALVVLAAATAFLPALGNGFVDFDDGIYILDNPWIRGLRFENLSWMLTAAKGGLWQPLTWLSFAVDYHFWNLDPWGFHFVNIVLHAATAGLFYAVCLGLFARARPELARGQAAVGAALAALFFAVHPLRVESVAWATERKDVLSGVFFMAVLLCRLNAMGARRKRIWEAAALVSFALSLSAKGTGVTLPVVVLILEIYPLRRLPADPRRWREKNLRPLWLGLVPYCALTAITLALNAATATEAGVLQGLSAHGLCWRLSQAAYGLLFYPIKTLWPSGLSPYYPPRPWFAAWSWQFVGCAGMLAASAAAIRRRPALAAAAACFAVMLSPMSGLVQQGMVLSAADRYSYLPCLGFAVLFGAALSGRGRGAKALAAAWLIALGVASWRQCGVWCDSTTFWSAALDHERNGFALSALGVALAKDGRDAEGMARLEEAVASYPDEWIGYDNLGVVLARRREEKRAIEIWTKGLTHDDQSDLHAHLGAALAQGPDSGLAEGLGHLRAAVALKAARASFRLDLADALARAGNAGQAESEYRAAAELDPRLERVQNNWGLLLARQGRDGEAVAHYRSALYGFETRAEANYNWGNVLFGQGRLDLAERHYREAVRIDSNLAEAQVNLANILVRRGRLAEAVARYSAALKKSPGLKEARANLAAVRRLLRR